MTISIFFAFQFEIVGCFTVPPKPLILQLAHCEHHIFKNSFTVFRASWWSSGSTDVCLGNCWFPYFFASLETGGVILLRLLGVTQ